MANERNAGRKRIIAPEQVSALYEAHKNGASMSELARTSGCSRQTLYSYFSRIPGNSNHVEIEPGPTNNNICTLLSYWKRLNKCFLDNDLIDDNSIGKFILRYEYYNRDKLMSIILVNLQDKKVVVLNSSTDTIHLAFGINLLPSWEDFTDFLCERCFPAGRDRMKTILRDYDLGSYDPFQIIEKTDGRMAEDRQWIKVIHFTPAEAMS